MSDLPPLPLGAQLLPPLPQGAVPIDQAMDKRSGAPSKVRLAVGSAQTDKDRLSTIRQFYPDAQPYNGNNFAFTDPETKRPTLYNPRGLDFGDVISAAPEVGEMGGGMIGGVLAAPAAIAGAPPTAGASLLAVPAAVGLGAAGGREATQLLAKALVGTQDTRGIGERLLDTGVTAGINATGTRIGEMASDGVRRLVQGLTGSARTPGAAVALNNAAGLGVDLPAGAATGSLATQRLERGVGSLPFGADIINRGYTQANEQLGAAAQRIGRTLGRGDPMSAQGAGETIRTAAQGAVQRFEARQDQLYDAAFNMIGRDTRVPLPGVQRLEAALQAELGQAPQARAGVLNPVIQRAQALLTDAANGVPFEALRAVRTDLGKLLKDPQAMSGLGTTDTQLRRLYGAMTEDIGQAARATSPNADRAMRLADRYTRYNVGDLGGRVPNAEILQKVLDSGTGEKAFQFALAGAKDGGSRLTSLRRNMRPEEWDVVSSSVWDRLGRAKSGQSDFSGMDDVAEFSPQTFVTNWNNLSAEAKSALFGGTRYSRVGHDRERVGQVAERLNAAARTANTSNTANTLGAQGLLYSVMGLGGALVGGGDIAAGATAVAASSVAPYAAARLLTSPGFVRWLATAPSTNRGVAQHLGRLAVVAKAEPAIRDEIEQYEAALRAAPAREARR